MRTLLSLSTVLMLSVLLAPSVLAQSNSSTLEQEIAPLECSHTSVETGTGTSDVSDCPVPLPPSEEPGDTESPPTVTGGQVEEGDDVPSESKDEKSHDEGSETERPSESEDDSNQPSDTSEEEINIPLLITVAVVSLGAAGGALYFAASHLLKP